jgi:hypothetical protein
MGFSILIYLHLILRISGKKIDVTVCKICVLCSFSVPGFFDLSSLPFL